MTRLDIESKFFQDNKENLLAKYEGKYVVIKGKAVIGIFDNRIKAIEATRKDHELGTFLVQHVVKESEIFFHSRVRIKKNDDKDAA